MLVSGVQQNDSVIHIHVSILFQILFPFGLLHNFEQSSLCYTVGPCWLSILNTAVCTCQFQTPRLSLPPHPSPLVTISSFSKSGSLFLHQYSIIYELNGVLWSLSKHARYGICASSRGRKRVYMTWGHILQSPGGPESFSSYCTVFMGHTHERSQLTQETPPISPILGQTDITCLLTGCREKNTTSLLWYSCPKRIT